MESRHCGKSSEPRTDGPRKVIESENDEEKCQKPAQPPAGLPRLAPTAQLA